MYDENFKKELLYDEPVLAESSSSTAEDDDQENKLKRFMTLLDSSHSNPILTSILFPAVNSQRKNNHYLITGSSGIIDPEGKDKKTSGEFIMWNILNSEKITTNNGHNKPISALACLYKEDIDYLITGSEDGSFIIWIFDWLTKHFDILCTDTPHKNVITGIAVYSPPDFYQSNKELNSYLFVTVSLDKTGIIFNFDDCVSKNSSKSSRLLGEESGDKNEKDETNDDNNDVEKVGPVRIRRINTDKNDEEFFDIDKHSIAIEVHKNRVYKKLILSQKSSKNKPLPVKSGGYKLRKESSIILSHDLQYKQDVKDGKKYKHVGGIMSIAIYTPRSECVRSCDKTKCDCFPRIITGSWDKQIIIWSLKTGESLRLLNGHTKGIKSIVIFDPEYPVFPYSSPKQYVSPKGSSPIIVTGGIDKNIIVWDLFEAVKIRKLPLEKNKIDLLDADDKENNSNKNSENLQNNFEVGHSAKVNSVFVFDSSLDQNQPRIVSSGHNIRTINKGHDKPILSICVYIPKERNNDFIISSCSEDRSKNLSLWDFATTRLAQVQEKCEHKAVTNLVVYDPMDGKHDPISIVAHIDGMITIWEILKLKQRFKLGGHNRRVNYLSTYPDNSSQSNVKKSYKFYLASCDGLNVIIIRHLEIFPNAISPYEYCSEARKLNLQFKDFFLSLSFFTMFPSKGGEPKVFLVKGGGLKESDKLTKIWSLERLLSMDNDKNKTTIIDENDSELLQNPDLSIAGHSDLVRCILPYNDKKGNLYLITGSYDYTAILYKFSIEKNNNITYNPVLKMTHHSECVFTVAVYDPTMYFQKLSNRKLLIFLGSFDNKVSIWDSGKVEALKVLNAHADSVTSIAICASSEKNPLLITSSIDKVILIWIVNVHDVTQTEILRKLTGHTDRVCSLGFYTVPKDSSNHEALIISGGDDETLIRWSDCLHYVKTMPTPAAVLKAFKFDLKSEDSWPMMRELSNMYKISLWLENTGLYFLALEAERKRLDFFKTFKSKIRRTLRYVNRIPVIVDLESNIFEHHSLLRHAMEIDDVQVIQIILDCWISNLNKDIEDPLSQRLYHPSYSFDLQDLFHLGKKYPQQFIYFMSKLKLIKTSEILNRKYIKTVINDDSRMVVSWSLLNFKTDLWKDIIDNIFDKRNNEWFFNLFRKSVEDVSKREVFSEYLPLVNPASREMLTLCLSVSNSEKSVDIFKGDFGRVILLYLWKKYAFESHCIQFFLYIIYVAWYSYSIYRFPFLIHDNRRGLLIFGWIVEFMLLISTFVYLAMRFYQVYHEYNDNRKFNDKYGTKGNEKGIFVTIRDHFFNIWNFNELMIAVFVITGTILRITDNSLYFGPQLNNRSYPTQRPTLYPSKSINNCPSSYPSFESTISSTKINVDSNQIKIFYALGTISVYFRILYYLRPFASSGPLVSMILQIAKDILYFLFILFIMMCSFAEVFWIINENIVDSYYGHSLWSTYVYSFMFMLGHTIEKDYIQSQLPFTLNIILLILFMLFMMLLMLNLLIALMNDSYTRVREKGLAQWRIEQGGVILNDFKSIKTNVDPFIYLLRYTSDSAELKTENEVFDTDKDWKEMFKLENKVGEETQVKNNNKKNFNEEFLDELREIIRSEIKQVNAVNE